MLNALFRHFFSGTGNKPDKEKIFCLSFQRTGTTSVGKFFQDFGYSVATWEVSHGNNWSALWLDGDYEAIFRSQAFRENTVFEDSPWWHLDFYKILYHRFPKARFVFFTRNPHDWFNSMMSHSNQKNPGNAYRHSRIYRREKELDELMAEQNLSLHDNLNNLLDLNESHRAHYIQLYELRNAEVLNFFANQPGNRFIHCTLEDSNKWVTLGSFFGLTVPASYEMRANSTEHRK